MPRKLIAFPGAIRTTCGQLSLFGGIVVVSTKRQEAENERKRQVQEVREFTEVAKDKDKSEYLLAEGDVASVMCPSCEHVGAKVRFSYGPGMRVKCLNCDYSWKTERARATHTTDAPAASAIF